MQPKHEIDIRVRYAEVDQMGVVHHARYFEYFEMGRTEALRACGLNYRDIEEAGYFLVITKVTCAFKMPARYDDILTLETWIEKLTRLRIDHAYRLWRDEKRQLVAEAASTLGCVDRNGQLREMPADLLDLFGKASRQE
ncbi:MAG: acyl-CoA thioesterase [Planctomycetes bacterium]|nr:acyl-CoA thioesterase [Planctomycetota bacterium]